MAEGNFYPNAALHLQVEGNTYTVSMTNSMEEDAPDYTGEAALRVYCEDADNTVIEVAQDGEYTEVESTVIGSYRQFTMEVPRQLPHGRGRGQSYTADRTLHRRWCSRDPVDRIVGEKSGKTPEDAQGGKT